MQIRKEQFVSQLKDRAAMEERIEVMRKDITKFTAKIKVPLEVSTNSLGS